MLSRSISRLSRSFSSNYNRRQYLKINMVYGMLVGGFFAGFFYYMNHSTPKEIKESRKEVLKSRLFPTTPFEGLARPQEAETVLEKSKAQFLIVFAHPNSGKTFFFRYLNHFYNPSILLEAQTEINETLDFFKFTPRMYENQFDEFFGMIRDTLENNKDSIFLIDSFEKLEESNKKRVIQILKIFAEKGTAKIIISTNKREVIPFIQSYIPANVHVLSELSFEEFLNICKGFRGFNFQDIKVLWEKCGSDIEYAKEMMESIEELGSCEKFLEIKKTKIRTWAIEKIKDDEQAKTSLQKFLRSVNEEKPLGDIFAASKLAREMNEECLTYDYLQLSVNFRNKFVVETLKELIKET